MLSDGDSSYSYNTANRLVGVSQGSDVYSYAYNGLGDRLQQVVNGDTTNYTLDLNTGLTQVLADGTNTYLYGLGRIGELQPQGWMYHLPDALGSVRQLSGPDAVPALAQSYAPFGENLASTGSGQSVFQYTGEARDGTGLTYLRNRYYETSSGRFLSTDPVKYGYGISRNPYPYALANPVNHTDPSGLSPAGNGPIVNCMQQPQVCLLLLEAAGAAVSLISAPVVIGGVIVVALVVYIGSTSYVLEDVPEAYIPEGIVRAPAPSINERTPEEMARDGGHHSSEPIRQQSPESIPTPKPDITLGPDILSTCTPESQRFFYFKDVMDYEIETSRETNSIIADMNAFSHIAGINGMIGQLQGAQNTMDKYGDWMKHMVMGRKYESERALRYGLSNNLLSVNSTSSKYDIMPVSLGTVEYVEVKWSSMPMPSYHITKAYEESLYHPSGTFLVESNNIDGFARYLLSRKGGREYTGDCP